MAYIPDLRTVPTSVSAHTSCASLKAWFKRYARAGVDFRDLTQNYNLFVISWANNRKNCQLRCFRRLHNMLKDGRKILPMHITLKVGVIIILRCLITTNRLNSIVIRFFRKDIPTIHISHPRQVFNTITPGVVRV